MPSISIVASSDTLKDIDGNVNITMPAFNIQNGKDFSAETINLTE